MVTLAVSTTAQAWRAPHGLEPLGAWVSIVPLTLTALLITGAALGVTTGASYGIGQWLARSESAQAGASVFAAAAQQAKRRPGAESVFARGLREHLARQHL